MTVLFSPDTVEANDPAGLARWLTGHFYEHQQFVQIAAGLSPPRLLVFYDLFSFDMDNPRTVGDWLNSHNAMHDSLSLISGVEGINLSQVDFTEAASFDQWQIFHAQEHAQLRRAFGIV